MEFSENRVPDFMRCSRRISFPCVLDLVIDRPTSLNVHPVKLCKHFNTNSMSVYISSFSKSERIESSQPFKIW